MSSSNGQQVLGVEKAVAQDRTNTSSDARTRSTLLSDSCQALQLPAIQLQLNTSRTATGGVHSNVSGTACKQDPTVFLIQVINWSV
jgi:hypothetical protein